MKTSKLFFLFLLTLCMYNCSYDSEDDLIDVVEDPVDPVDPGVLINYTDNIAPIMQSACVSCHSSPPVNGAPFALVNFDQVSQRSGGILNAMNRQSGTPSAMPPPGRLPQSTIDIIQKWIDDGRLEN